MGGGRAASVLYIRIGHKVWKPIWGMAGPPLTCSKACCGDRVGSELLLSSERIECPGPWALRSGSPLCDIGLAALWSEVSCVFCVSKDVILPWIRGNGTQLCPSRCKQTIIINRESLSVCFYVTDTPICKIYSS